MARRRYFEPVEDGPEPLTVSTGRRVRFEEVDSIGMMWHGRYPSYFEDGRIAFGDTYGLGYSTFVRHRIMAPIAQMHFDFKAPLRFDELTVIETMLHWNESMRLDFSYIIRNSSNAIAATGYTVQLLTEADGTVLFVPPDWIIRFREKWRAGFWDAKK
jgi:acyl-CoA thioester hydrolase